MRFSFLFLLAAVVVVAPAALAQPLYLDVTDDALPTLPFNQRATMDIEVADLDGDEDLDIVLACEACENVLLLNNGDGTFADGRSRFPVSNSYDSEDIAIADFDGDDDLDLIFVQEDFINFNGIGRQHEFFLNDGTGTFTPAAFTFPDSEANAIAVADLNGDDRPDVVIGNADQDFVFINDGAGGFINETAARIPAEDRINQDLTFADVDGDDDLDLFVGNENDNALLLNDGTGVFTDVSATNLPTSPLIETRKATFADVDGDDDLDLYLSNVFFLFQRDPQDRLWLNDGTGVFTDATATNLPASAATNLDATFVDVDGDNDLDLLTHGVGQTVPVRLLTNDGAGVFTDATDTLLPFLPTTDGLALEVADFDGDERLDLFIGNRGQIDRLLLRDPNVGTSTETGGVGPTQPLLAPPYPNPVDGLATLEIKLDEPQDVLLAIYDLLGRRVATVHEGVLSEGAHTRTVHTHALSAGVYLCRLTTADAVVSHRLVVAGNS
ncbi:MAG: T9SS type A sorting domain-containing protein [Bacteroidota bacterium]